MDSERWLQIERLFHSALERSPGARAAFLAQACANDESLQREVESLIESHKQADSFIDAPATDIAADLLAHRETGLRAGESVGPYRIISTLGEGGMGEVYLAQDIRLGRQVALKRLPTELNLDPDRVRRFEQEARAVSALNHPNIVTIYEIGRVNSFPFITTEFIDGGTLRQHLDAARMDLDEVLEVAIQIASALTAAHAAGIVHRDIKPENIMIRLDGYLKVLDFGLAKLVEDKNKSFLGLEDSTAKQNQTASGVILGTVHYMSPEQAKGERVDERTDIFSLGAVMYEMLAGKTPFAGSSKSETFANLINQEPQPLSGVVPHVPHALQRIVFKTLCKNRDDRYQTIKDLLVDLKDLREKLTLSEKLNESRLHKNGEATASLPATTNNGDEPAFSETIKRRGYGVGAGEQRVETNEENSGVTNGAVVVLADWRHETDENQAANSASASATEKPNAKTGKLELVPATSAVKNKRINYFYFLAGLILVVGLLVAAVSRSSWFLRGKSLGADAPVLSASFSSEKLSTTGKVIHAVISPDGKNVVYTNGVRGQESVWLRQLESTNNIEIIPPSGVIYGRLAFSPDGNSIYFTRRSLNVEGGTFIYRVPIFGGVPTKIVNEVQSPFSISPDGGRISFVRNLKDEGYSLWIVGTDGSNERRLVSRPGPFRIGHNQISPDGKTVAFAVGQSDNAANEFGLVEVNIESGAVRELTTQKFFNIHSLVWLPNQSGLLIAASTVPNKKYLLWQVSVATGDASPLTKDSEDYSELSLDKAAGVIVATQTKADFHLLLYNRENPSDKRILADAMRVGFAPSGKLVFSSLMSGNAEIWSINADGSEQRQLTNDPADDATPVSSPDNRFIFFISNRTGEAQVWRMNADGSNQTQITFKEGGAPTFVSPDGRWVYYLHSLQTTLWRASTEGGEEQLVLNKRRYPFAFSPDGSRVAFPEGRAGETALVIVSLADGRIIKTFNYAAKFAWQGDGLKLGWLPDGKSLMFVLVDNEFDNSILWLQPLDAETPQKIADLGEEGINSLAISPDGKSFAVVQGGWKADAVLIKGLR